MNAADAQTLARLMREFNAKGLSVPLNGSGRALVAAYPAIFADVPQLAASELVDVRAVLPRLRDAS